MTPSRIQKRALEAELLEATLKNLDSADDCEGIHSYQIHFFLPKKGAYYCVRTKKGHAKILLVDLNDDQVLFDWIYNPTHRNEP